MRWDLHSNETDFDFQLCLWQPKTHIYSYAATTQSPPRPIMQTTNGIFGSASQHAYGIAARNAIETARDQVASLIHADASEIIWTSGATESNNLAIKGIANLYQRRGKHIVTMKTEHKSVLDTCMHLEKEGFQITYLSPEPNGLLDIEKFKSLLHDDTILVSIMHVNNETGVIQDLDAIAAITSAKQILFHVDAAQSPGKINIDITKTPLDLLSLCAHKAYGPKGVGALYLRKKPRVRVAPLMHGGGHEQGMRSGTLATHQIIGMGEAMHLAQQEMQQEKTRISSLRADFIKGLSKINNMHLNTETPNSVPHILNLRFDGMLADAILKALPNMAASTASACQGKGTEGSYVLRAMGFSAEQIKNSIRFSFGRFTTQEEISQTVQMLQEFMLHI